MERTVASRPANVKLLTSDCCHGTKRQMTDFQAALQTKQKAKTLLEAAGIHASYLITVTDKGPRIRIQVHPSDFDRAQAIVPCVPGVTITDQEE